MGYPYLLPYFIVYNVRLQVAYFKSTSQPWTSRDAHPAETPGDYARKHIADTYNYYTSGAHDAPTERPRHAAHFDKVNFHHHHHHLFA